jgi:membrane-associated phospholipid phosphatase
VPAVVTVGRPAWWLMTLSVVVTVVVTADLLGGGRLGRLDLRVSDVVGGWNLRHGHAYPVLWLGTQLGGRGFILAVLAVLVGYLAWRRRVVRPLVRVLVALALLTGVIYGFKYGAGRTAPAYPGSFFHREGASYPSGHVANAVLMWGLARWQAAAYGLAAGWQRLFRVLSLLGPVVAGVTMVVLNFHWVTDAVVGAAVGIVLLGVVHALDAIGLSLWVHARAGRRSA